MLHMTGIVADYRNISRNLTAKTGAGEFYVITQQQKRGKL